jgi:hypothetical protein
MTQKINITIRNNLEIQLRITHETLKKKLSLMKKTISINISGQVFNIEEDGYDKLKGYLGAITKYFSSYGDSKEILTDIEGRIAEKFFDYLKKD